MQVEGITFVQGAVIAGVHNGIIVFDGCGLWRTRSSKVCRVDACAQIEEVPQRSGEGLVLFDLCIAVSQHGEGMGLAGDALEVEDAVVVDVVCIGNLRRAVAGSVRYTEAPLHRVVQRGREHVADRAAVAFGLRRAARQR
ncbi:MAG: hypothetical protein D6775_09230, partial [Caldilineae bacterium]